ncbi:hypothetical protein ALI22I_20500 [Saccharothrix sp. ALI-22-I]|uniref:hypothetical protein n=1 Tax=Saccharothrix sp. ALI-22-I TaxID=1933778 RepID=UPI00097CB4DF|nr:hypothetical protein [Saccharothrix sp. ALI-22-I]ONI88121.1 hypothetical protein ALI22I_20500 [Saccharothrix sp. ALI-22-I]
MITADSFPTPHLALRDPAQERQVLTFAHEQAAIAESLRRRLAPDWRRRTPPERVALLRRTCRIITEWRYNLAASAPGRLGAGIPLDAERFRTKIKPGQPRIDRLGYSGRLRTHTEDNPLVWDPDTHLYVGGESTPAHEIMLRYGQDAHERMDTAGAGDVLVNRVVLPSGRTLDGTTLVRGEEAQRIAAALVARVAARGRDASRMETGDYPVYLVTADPAARALMLDAALNLFAADQSLDPDHALPAVQAGRYLLVEAPEYYKGADASIRVLVVVVGALLTGRAMLLEQDMDLRCLVGGQDAATEMPADTSPRSA